MNEILFVGLDIVYKLFCGMLSCKRVGVVAIGEKHYFDVEPLLQKHVDTAERSMYARRIAIVEDGYVVRKPMNQANLLFGEGCAATADYVFDTCLRH